MTDVSHGDDSPQGPGRYVPLLAGLITAAVLLLIPLKILGGGFLPADDALADAAKAINGKPWPEILVMRSDYAIDNHIGWHAVLRAVWSATHWTSEGLVLFSVAGLFTLVGWSALPWLRRPEAWLVAWIVMPGIAAEFMGRFMLGRPLMITIAALVAVLFLWQTRGAAPPKASSVLLMGALIAVAVALHGVWYLWALPLAAFLLAREWRWAVALAVAWAGGTLLGGCLTGHPIVYLTEAVHQVANVTGRHFTARTQVSEMQPTPGNTLGLMWLGALLAARLLGGITERPWRHNPAFWLACIGWVLGYQAARFWADWGLPALMVLTAADVELILEKHLRRDCPQRVPLAAGLALALFLATTSDSQNRWTGALTDQYLTEDDSNLKGWLPEPGGIFYAADMAFFYQTFYHNPTAPWRYMVGFEPIFMPEADFDTYHKILFSGDDPKAYQPWVDKMKPADRMVMDAGSARPVIAELEWNHVTRRLWIGRLRKPRDPGTDFRLNKPPLNAP